MNYFFAITVAGLSRWAGFCPFELNYPSATPASSNLFGDIYTSTRPLEENLYRQKVLLYEAMTEDGETSLGHEWVEYTYRVHEQMADGYYFRKETSDSTSEASYDLEDDGDEAGAEPDWSDEPSVIDGMVPAEVSRSATEAVYEYLGPGDVVEIRLTVTLSLLATPANAFTRTETLRNVINIQTPGNDYSPSVATKYTISGNERILCAVPIEYYDTSDEAYYFVEGTNHLVITEYQRTGGGIAAVHTLSTIAGTGYTSLIGTGLANSLRVANVAITPTFVNWPQLWSANEFFSTKGKMMVDGNMHRMTDSMEHDGGPVEDDASWQGWDLGTLVERTSFARKQAGVVPPAQTQTEFAGFPDEVVDWLPYYVLVEPDQAASSETQRGTAIYASAL